MCTSPLIGTWLIDHVEGNHKFIVNRCDRSLVKPNLDLEPDAPSSSWIPISCGQCIQCRLKRSRQWACRCAHEASLYTKNSYLTLTFSDDNLPQDLSLRKYHVQNFIKRLRKRYLGFDPVSVNGKISYPIRYYAAGEYGSKFGRPHYHLLIFNFDFDDKVFFKKNFNGDSLYRSQKLEELWPFGFCTIGDVTFKSAAYVARYIMKKVLGKNSKDLYEGKVPEFCLMSLKPGIGAGWLQKYHSDVYPHDYVVFFDKDRRPVQMKPPKHYDTLFERMYPDQFAEVKESRVQKASLDAKKFTELSLINRETVYNIKAGRLIRNLEEAL